MTPAGGPEFDAAPPVVQGAVVAVLTRLVEAVERVEGKVDALVAALKARGSL